MSKKVLTEENQSVIIQIVQNGQEHVQKSDRDKGGTMIQIKCVSGEPAYMETELGAMLSAGWEIISIETSIYESYGTVRKDVTAFLKKASE